MSPYWRIATPGAGAIHTINGGQWLALPDPLHQIDQPPAHHPVDRRDRPALDDTHERLTLVIVQLGRVSRRLAADQPVRAAGVEPSTPSKADLRKNHLDLDIMTGVPSVRIRPSPIIGNLDRQKTNHAAVDQPPLSQCRPPLVDVLPHDVMPARDRRNAQIAAPSLAHDRDLLLVRPTTPPLRAHQDLLPHQHTSKRRQ